MSYGKSVDETIARIKELDHAISSNWEIIQQISYHHSKYPQHINKPVCLRSVDLECETPNTFSSLISSLEYELTSATFDDGNDDNSNKVTISKNYDKCISAGLNIIIDDLKDDHSTAEYISFNKQWSYYFWESNYEAKIPTDEQLERMADAMYSSMMEEKEQPPTISWKTLLTKLNR